jgi:hypothetical protein
MCYTYDVDRTKKELKPHTETRRKMEPISREFFTRLIGKAIKTPASKPAPKST